MNRLIAYTCKLAVALLFACQPLLLASTINSNTTVNVPNPVGLALNQVIEIAESNKLPLGVVLAGDILCTTNLMIDNSRPLLLGAIVDQINKQVAGYRALIQDGTLHVEPDVLSSSTGELLNLQLSYFRPETTTMRGLSDYLWMYVRSVIVPQDGTMMSIISNPDDPTISGFRVEQPSSTAHILDLIVHQGKGGMWILSNVNANWKENMNHNPLSIVDYSARGERLAIENCRKQQMAN